MSAVEKVKGILQEKNLKLKLKKIPFGVLEVETLRYKVKAGEMRLPPITGMP